MRVCASPDPASHPYTSLLYSAVEATGATVDTFSKRRLLRRRYDVVHVHWPEWNLYGRFFPRMVAQTVLYLAVLECARWRGARLVWTVHNVEPHERTSPRFSRWFWWAFTGMVDGFVSLTESGLDLVRRRYPRLRGKPAAVVPLGHLRGQYPAQTSRTVARQRLGIPAGSTVVTYFGHVRPYKNVPSLVRAFRALPDVDTVLLVAGRPLNDMVRSEVEEAALGDGRVQLHLGFIPHEDVQHYLVAADLVVLPYAESTNSFVALLALSFDRPILAPAIGAFPELARAAGSQWVRLYDGEICPGVLAEALAASRGRTADGEGPDLETFAWPAIGAATVAAYRTITGQPHRGATATLPASGR